MNPSPSFMTGCYWIDPEQNPHKLLGSTITDVAFEKDKRGKALHMLHFCNSGKETLP